MIRNHFPSMQINNDIPVLVFFYAPWCTYCQSYLPLLEELAEESGSRLQLMKINVDKQVAMALRYSIRTTPTIMISHRGKILWKKGGPIVKNELYEKFSNLLPLEGVY